MRSLFFLLIKLGLLVSVFVWLANHPGTAQIRWEGWQIETTPALLVGGSLILAWIFYTLFRGVAALRAGPRAWARRRRSKRQEAGIEALTQGLLALSAGDAEVAKAKIKTIYQGLGNRPLALLLTAHAALLKQDWKAAREAFTELCQKPEVAFLGYRGLLNVERITGNIAAAQSAARMAQTLKPKAQAVLQARLDLAARSGDWSDYRQAIEIGAHVLTANERRHHQAVAAMAEAKTHEAAGDSEALAAALEQALTQDSGFLPALLMKSRLLAANEGMETARRFAEKQWGKHPHPGFLPYLRIETKVGGQYRQIEKRLRGARRHPETELALGQAALEDRLWEEARRHLESARAAPETERRALRALAQLAETDSANPVLAAQLQAQAQGAALDPGWRCAACGAIMPEWEAVCPACAMVGSCHWGQAGDDGSPVSLRPPSSALLP